MPQPLAILVGFIGKLPLAGMALANLHYIVGLRELGYQVHYVERQNKGLELYDPGRNEMTDECSGAIAFIESVLPRYGLDSDAYSFIDRNNHCHGAEWPALRSAIRRAEFVINMGDATWFEELALCPRRAFVDADPLFTQVDVASGTGHKASVVEHYDTLFTEGWRIAREGCTIPLAGRRWIPVRPAIATSCWSCDADGRDRPITTLMNWSSGREVTVDGIVYGYKNREFERFVDLPQLVGRKWVVALGGSAPRQALMDKGWEIRSALNATLTIEKYRDFITGSSMDLGIAKHAYVKSRSGWFSDRSTCYMASGRPVLHQDTGLADCMPVGRGVIPFDSAEEAAEGVRALELDYEMHSRAARALAEEYFEASKVIRQMLIDAGWS